MPPPSAGHGAVSAPWFPWAPGVRLLRRVGPWGRAPLLLAATLLPALPWLAQAAGAGVDPRPAGYALLTVPLYAWVCAGLALRRVPAATSGPAATSPQAVQRQPVTVAVASRPPAGPEPGPPVAIAQASGAASPPAAAAAQPIAAGVQPLPAAAMPVLPGTASSSGSDPAARSDAAAAVPAPSGSATAGPSHRRPAHEPPPAEAPAVAVPANGSMAEAGLAADEIGRRVIAASGVLYGCAQLLEGGRGDIDALAEEESRARSLLWTLDSRLSALDRQGRALAQAALALAPDEGRREELTRLAQQLLAHVAHGHRLIEALDTAEGRRGARLQGLRHGFELVGNRIERVLRGAQPSMQLTRRIAATLGAAARGASAGAPPQPPDA